ncbi:MAG: hypothetical protein IKF80_07675 [Erysipelotrichaceae bacterium]|nr:hypothetical protein [Erysipelotrichaceae bacterium]
MNRDSEFNATKLTSISNGKTIIDTYVDSFDIEKVKIVVAELEGAKRRINLYIDFADFMRLTMQIKSQSYLVNKTKTKALELCRGGYGYRNEVNSTSLTLGMSGDKLFFNAMQCPGIRTGNGAIIPMQGIQDSDRIKISVPSSYEDCLAMFLYVEKAIDVYLRDFFPQLFERARAKRSKQDTYKNTGYYPDAPNEVYYPDPIY